MKHRFKHYTDAIDTIKKLKSERRYDELEELLLWCVKATEAESKRKKWGVAPFYYGELAKLYRKRKDYEAEVGILERYATQQKAPGGQSQKLADRLVRARELRDKA